MEVLNKIRLHYATKPNEEIQMAEGQRFYVRQASGIVRNISPLNAMALASGCSNLAGATAAMFIWMPYLYPGADLVWSIIIAVILSLAQGALYAIFAASMPRAGGDYIYISRTLHPALGFAGSFAFMATMVAYSGILCWLQVGLLSSAFVLLGQIFSIKPALDFGVWMMGQDGLLIMGTVMLLVAFGTVVFGIKTLRSIIMMLFAIGTVWALLTIGILGTTSLSTFQALLDKFVGTPGTYQNIIAAAKSEGFTTRPVNLYDTLGAVVLVIWGIYGYWTSSYYAGEMKELRRNAVTSILGTVVVWGIFAVLFAALLVRATGFDFLASAGYLYYSKPDLLSLSVPPTLPFLEAIMTQNVVVGLVIAVGLMAWSFIYFPSYFTPMSRVLFAWSWDRIAPAKFASISKRFASPYIAVAIIAALFEFFLIAWLYKPEFFMVNLFFTYVPLYCLIGISGLIFPYVKKQIYEKSAMKPSIAGIPVISICGAVTIITWLIIAYFIMANPAIVGEVSTFTIVMTAGVYLLAILIYYIAVYYHKSRGMDIRLIFKEVPPA